MCQNKHFPTWPWKAAKWSLSKVDPTIGTSWNLDPFEPPGGPKDSKISFSNFLFLQAYKLFLSVLLNFFLSKSRGSGIKSSLCGQILATIWRWKFLGAWGLFSWEHVLTEHWTNQTSRQRVQFSFFGYPSTAKPSSASPLQVVFLFCNCLTTNSIHSQAPQVQSWLYFHSAYVPRGQKTGAAKLHALNSKLWKSINTRILPWFLTEVLSHHFRLHTWQSLCPMIDWDCWKGWPDAARLPQGACKHPNI